MGENQRLLKVTRERVAPAITVGDSAKLLAYADHLRTQLTGNEYLDASLSRKINFCEFVASTITTAIEDETYTADLTRRMYDMLVEARRSELPKEDQVDPSEEQITGPASAPRIHRRILGRLGLGKQSPEAPPKFENV